MQPNTESRDLQLANLAAEVAALKQRLLDYEQRLALVTELDEWLSHVRDKSLGTAAGGGPAPGGTAGGDLGGTYPNPTVDDGADSTAIHDNVANEITGITNKNPVAADEFVVEDSAASYVKKAVLFSALEAALTHDNLVAGTIADHDTGATGAELDTLTDGSDADSLHDHGQFASAAEAIAAVEGEATLDLTGDVTVAGSKSLAVDTISEKTADAGVIVDQSKIDDKVIYPDKDDAQSYLLRNASGDTYLGGDTGDYIMFDRSENIWYVDIGATAKFRVDATGIKADVIGELTGDAGVTVDEGKLLDGHVYPKATKGHQYYKVDISGGATDGDTTLNVDDTDYIRYDISANTYHFYIASTEYLQVYAGGIKADVIAELTGAAGITLDSVLLKDGNVVISDAGYLGSASDTDAIQIEADGDVVMTQDLAVTGDITGANIVTAGNVDGVDISDQVPVCKWDAEAAPDADNDVDEGYTPGSRWVDVTNDKAYVCLDNTDGAAVWTEVTAAGNGNGGATVALDNLDTVQINADLLVDTDSSYDLGDATHYWANAYIDDLYLSGVMGAKGTTPNANYWVNLSPTAPVEFSSETIALRIFPSATKMTAATGFTGVFGNVALLLDNGVNPTARSAGLSFQAYPMAGAASGAHTVGKFVGAHIRSGAMAVGDGQSLTATDIWGLEIEAPYVRGIMDGVVEVTNYVAANFEAINSALIVNGYQLRLGNIENATTKNIIIEAGPATPYMRLEGGAAPAGVNSNAIVNFGGTLYRLTRNAGTGAVETAAI